MDIPSDIPSGHDLFERARITLLALSVMIASAACSEPSRSTASGNEPDHSSHHTDAPSSPYSAVIGRHIKALSPDETEALLAGEGMGMALAAELNGYPGPKHVLELSSQLQLDTLQLQDTRTIFEAMQKKARPLGARIVSAEADLDRAFADGSISNEGLERRADDIGRLRAELRAVHLLAHLEMAELLTDEQVQRYQELRGYVSVRQ